ncbi:hydrophobe/amphiphile efflux-3 (HAE3) family transporter [Pyrococcus sp. ST04]|uniref:hydrophobe/amphiphile efflux-3 (HAE3) family transporter n=1 Tax=Pyrococcus sp. ST04 TaxID=1183377 RepID=UPI0002605A4E|nr:hydrophobe/amphiphile efflux-3 (HAE3) family transporter [Pyrococcus sp. ST04]AFK22015.1 putativeMembrane transport protein, MMPL type [Pyrococcus sp. ST04]
MLRKVAKVIVVYRHSLAVITLFLLILSAYGLTQLRFESDLSKQLPSDLEAVKSYFTLQNEFGAGGSALIYVKIKSTEEVSDIRDPRVIQAMYNLEQRLKQREYVTSTFSIADLCVQILGRPPKNKEEVEFVLNFLPPEARNGLISRDYSSTIIIVNLNRERNQKALVRVYRDIESDIKRADFPEGVEAVLTGDLGITYRILEMLQNDMNRTMMVAGVIVILILLYFYKSPIRMLVPLIPLIFGVVMTLGFMGLLGIPLDIATSTIGAMIIGMGIDYGVHVTNRYYEERSKGRPPEIAAEEAIAETGKALLGAALTTIAGFLALSISILPSLKRLSVTLVMGLGLTALNAVIVTPALAILEEDFRRIVLKKSEIISIGGGESKISGLFRIWGAWIKKLPWIALLIALIISGISFYGLTKVTTEVRLEKMIPMDLPEIKALMDIRSEFGGQDEVYVLIKAEDVRDPTLVRSILRFEREVKADSYINNVFEAESIADEVLKKYGYIPQDKEKIAEALKDSSLISSDYSMTIIKFKGNFMGVTQSEFNKIMEYFEEEIKMASFPPGTKVELAGDAYLNYVLNNLVNEELGKISTIGTMIVVLVVFLIFRRPTVSIAMIMPMFLGALWTIGYMGLAGIPFSQTLAGVVSMIVGLGVDYGMHITHRFLEELREGNKTPIIAAMGSVGPGILVGALTTAGGFLALLTAQLTAIHDFGRVLAVGIFASMFSAYLVTPAILQLEFGRKIKGVRK